MKIHTLSFPTLGLTTSVRVVDQHNCLSFQPRVVSYLFIRFICSSNQILSFSWILFGCRERWGGGFLNQNCLFPWIWFRCHERCSEGSTNQNCSASWIPFGCCDRCGGVLMVCSLPSSSIVSPQRSPSGASLSSLNGPVQVLLRLCLTTIYSQIDHTYIYTEP
jgi:hypothetical protein